MHVKNAVIGGVIGGVIGAVLWGAVGYFTGREVGWVAWLVGLLTGIGVRSALANKGSSAAGVLAAAVAFGAGLAGKFAVAELSMHRFRTEIAAALAQEPEYSREDVIGFMCTDLVVKYEEQGTLFEWPEDVDPDDAYLPEHFPSAVVEEASAAWDGLTSAEQRNYLHAMHGRIVGTADEATRDGSFFLASFGPFDILWMLLALSTAFKVASQNDGPTPDAGSGQQASRPDDDAAATSGWRWPAGSEQPGPAPGSPSQPGQEAA